MSHIKSALLALKMQGKCYRAQPGSDMVPITINSYNELTMIHHYLVVALTGSDRLRHCWVLSFPQIL